MATLSAFGLTWIRVAPGALLCEGILAGRGSARNLAMLAIIVAADVLDGVWARRVCRDTNLRRVLDSMLDKASIHAVFVVFVSIQPHVLWVYLPIAARDLVQALAAGRYLLRFNRIVTGGRWHKLSSLSVAALGAVLLTDPASNLVAPVAATAWLANAVLLLDYLCVEVPDPGPTGRPARLEIEQLAGLRRALGRSQMGDKSSRIRPVVG